MPPDQASEKLQAALTVTREDIARAKNYLLGTSGGRTDELADEWLARLSPRALPPRACEDLLREATPELRQVAGRPAEFATAWRRASNSPHPPCTGPRTFHLCSGLAAV